MKSLVETDSGEEVDKIVYKKFTQICPMDALWQVETGHGQGVKYSIKNFDWCTDKWEFITKKVNRPTPVKKWSKMLNSFHLRKAKNEKLPIPI